MKLIFSLFLFTLLATPVLAQTPGTSVNMNNLLEEAGGAAGYDTSGDPATSVAEVVATVIYVFLTIIGILLVVYIIYAGFRWMTSAGNEEAIEKSKKTITSAIIGVIIILMAYAITTFVISRFVPVSQGSGGGGGVQTSQ